jgi:hypothetical protein
MTGVEEGPPGTEPSADRLSEPMRSASVRSASVDDDLAWALEEFLAQFASWAERQAAAEAVAHRRREEWIRRRSEEEATWHAVTLGLSEARSAVTVHLSSGRALQGTAVGAGADFLAVQAGRRLVFVADEAIDAIRRPPGARAPAASDDRGASRRLPGLADICSWLAAERADVLVGWRHGGEPISGRLVAAGHDVLSLRLPSRPPATLYARLASVAEVSALLSG